MLLALVLVELFTSEGCSSCPPADALLKRLVETDPNVVGLELHVDYWDHLGWKDPFSSRIFTERQKSYGPRLYTPQMVVDGVEAFVGGDERRAREAVERAARAPKGTLAVERTASGIRISGQSDEPGELWLATVEDGRVSKVERGENEGRTLAHAPVARSLERVGAVAGRFSLEARLGGKRRAVAFVQGTRSRRVLAVGLLAGP